ncbi:MAG: DNA primase small subunit domain-containing protein [archaeon]
MDSVAFLREKFRGYYKSNVIEGPPDIARREFGFGEFGKKISSRHLAFSGKGELNRFLREQTPFFISYSAAYYEFPSARPMQAKVMQKSDLIYEFDADDIKTDCKQTHDSWSCSCGAAGKGKISNCTKCGLGVKVDEWVCPECLGAVKSQARRLLDFLENDFGISGGFFFNFSGSKGFHIHVRSGAFSFLSSTGRVELADYLTAHGLDFERLGFVFLKGKRFVCPQFSTASGWGKRILFGLSELFERGDAEEIAALGCVSEKTAVQVLSNKESVLSGFERGVLFSLPGAKTQKFWLSLLGFVSEKQKLGIDRQTSIDSAKIIRVPDTIHGSTGLLAKEFTRDELGEFDGLSDGVIFSGKPIKLKSVSAPRFYLGKQWWGPFDRQDAELPEFVGIYLLSKGHAQIA